jgi:2-dehydropantoate 2-reductase
MATETEGRSTAGAKHISVIGIGAVGGYVAGKLARGGFNVTGIDPWFEHVEFIKANGVQLENLPGDFSAPLRAIHMHEVQSLIRTPVDIAIICTKSFDTDWVATMIRPYLSRDGYVVSMQNGINEERVAGAVGWGRTVGCIISTIGVFCHKAGHVRRIRQPGSTTHPVFRVGEVHGRVTQRATELATILSAVDHSTVTTDLWGERWTKLASNSITHGLLGATGLDNRVIYAEHGSAQRLAIRCASEAILVGRALGFGVGNVYAMEPELWLRAAGGEETALSDVRKGLQAWFARHTEHSQSSVGRDVARGRRSEVAFTNGLVAEKAKEAGVPAPTHAALTEIVERIDRGQLRPHRDNIEGIA